VTANKYKVSFQAKKCSKINFGDGYITKYTKTHWRVYFKHLNLIIYK
jgi:hypothetical protein